jgi:hypothetical protein
MPNCNCNLNFKTNMKTCVTSTVHFVSIRILNVLEWHCILLTWREGNTYVIVFISKLWCLYSWSLTPPEACPPLPRIERQLCIASITFNQLTCNAGDTTELRSVHSYSIDPLSAVMHTKSRRSQNNSMSNRWSLTPSEAFLLNLNQNNLFLFVWYDPFILKNALNEKYKM